MNLLKRLGDIVDEIVCIGSPRRALGRRGARNMYYAAAKTPRTSNDWTPFNTPDVNDIIGASSETVKARVRQLVRDFPYFAKACNALVDYTVGSGIMYQSRIQLPNGDLNKRLINEVESSFNRWADEADAAGKLHFYELMALAKRQDVESGEFLLVKKQVKESGRYLPFALQAYEADWLTTGADTGRISKNNANIINQGIEYKPSTGKVVAYHFTDPSSWGKTQRIPASNVVHGFRTLRPGQLRGISDFVSAVMVAHDLGDLMESELDGAKMAAKWLAVVKRDDPYGAQAGNVTTTDDGDKVEDLENAIIEYLRPGEDIEFKSSNRPGNNFMPYVRLILTMISTATGIPYEILSGDYKGLNYSTGKMVRNDFIHAIRPVSVRHIRQFCQPSLIGFMDSAVMSGKLSLPNYFTNPQIYLRAEWQPPGMESVDPARETKSYIDQMSKGLRSPQEIAKSRGRDLEDIYGELKAAKEMADEYGLDFAEVSTALANNPAALDKQGRQDDIIDKLDEVQSMIGGAIQ